MDNLSALRNQEPKSNKQVYRLKTNVYKSSSGAYIWQKKLTNLKRKSKGFEMLDADFSSCDPELVNIVNLYEVPDGVYGLICINVSRDWESGYLDGWDYRLVPENERTDEN